MVDSQRLEQAKKDAQMAKFYMMHAMIKSGVAKDHNDFAKRFLPVIEMLLEGVIETNDNAVWSDIRDKAKDVLSKVKSVFIF